MWLVIRLNGRYGATGDVVVMHGVLCAGGRRDTGDSVYGLCRYGFWEVRGDGSEAVEHVCFE